MVKVEELLPELAKFSPQKIQKLLSKLREEIKIGLERIAQGEPPTQADGGLLAIPYPLGWPNRGKLPTCPAQRVLTCVFAGQNWRAEVWDWDGSKWHLEEKTQIRKVIREKDRVFRGREAFSRYIVLMVDVVQAALEKAKDPGEISYLAVSYGFPQKNEKVNYGVEASLVTDSPSKYWSIEEAAGKHLGKPLLAELKERGYRITKIYFANDTLAVALDALAGEETLPVGVVIGNGANMAMESRGFLVNLESGRSRNLGADSILNKMRELELIPEAQAFPVLEYYFTGAYQLPRLIAALHLLVDRLRAPQSAANFLNSSARLQDKRALADSKFQNEIRDDRVVQMADWLLQTLKEKGNDSRILDQLIVGEMDRKELSVYLSSKTPQRKWRRIDEEDFTLVRKTTQLVMRKAVEIAALMMTSVLQVGGWREGQIPAVGSVFWRARVTPKGKIFGEEVMRLVNRWIEADFKAVRADELRGVAGLGLLGSQEQE